MTREELELITFIVESAYRSDDYVNWNFVNSCEGILEKEKQNGDQTGNNGRSCENLV